MTQFSYCTFWSLAARIQCHSPRSCGLQGVQHKAQGHGHAGMSIYNCGEESGFARRPAGTVGCEIAMQALAIDCSGGRESPVDSDGTESIIDGLDEDCLLLAKIDDRLQPVILFDWVGVASCHSPTCIFERSPHRTIHCWPQQVTILWKRFVMPADGFQWADLSFYGYRIDSDERFAGPVEEALRALEASVLELLDLALESGQVYIVTNSEAGWVEMSARRFLPSVVRLLDKITVISARSIYERDFPGCPSAWKLQAFMQMTDLFRGRTVVSLGDSYGMELGRRGHYRILILGQWKGRPYTLRRQLHTIRG